jgi:hypothetical protein
MNGVPFSFVWSCSVAPFWCSFYTVTCGPLVGVLYFLGLLVGSLVLPEMGIVASGQLETCRLGVSIQTTILGFFLSLAILRQSKLRIEYTEKGFQLLSSQKGFGLMWETPICFVLCFVLFSFFVLFVFFFLKNREDAFIRTVSHEIRTPLQGLVSSAELLGAERLPQSARMYVETISHCSSTLKLLIENVLGAGPSNLLLPQPSEVEISELVRKVEKYGEALALSKPWISVKVFSHVQAKALLLPETPLLQILLNFIANAVKVSCGIMSCHDLYLSQCFPVFACGQPKSGCFAGNDQCHNSDLSSGGRRQRSEGRVSRQTISSLSTRFTRCGWNRTWVEHLQKVGRYFGRSRRIRASRWRFKRISLLCVHSSQGDLLFFFFFFRKKKT